MPKNLWILTEERPKKEVIGQILKKFIKEKGISVEPKREVIEYDCTIAMIQTLVLRDFGETDFHSFGLSIFDECHHLGAAHFSKALLKVQPKHMLGLSATPTRDDGLTKVFEWFLGKPIHWEKTREADPDVIVKFIVCSFFQEFYNIIY
jgi:superfamily II DNA or RNA helicase